MQTRLLALLFNREGEITSEFFDVQYINMCITLYFCPAFAWYCGFVNEDICLFVVAIAKEKFTLVRPLPNPNLGTINESVKKADVAVQGKILSGVTLPAGEYLTLCVLLHCLFSLFYFV